MRRASGRGEPRGDRRAADFTTATRYESVNCDSGMYIAAAAGAVMSS